MSNLDATNRASADRTLPSNPSAAFGRRTTSISDRHLSKLAIVYVRQSSTQQIFDHKESRERQYALADYAATLGWPSPCLAYPVIFSAAAVACAAIFPGFDACRPGFEPKSVVIQ
jgi:hypothetical protein